MVKEIHKHENDPTLALSLLAQFSSLPVFSILDNQFKNETAQLFSQFNELQNSDNGNDVNKLLAILQGFHKKCHKQLPGQVDQLISTTLIDLYELSFNVTTYQVTITSKTDAFTLNHACYFITVLEAFIDEVDKSSSFLEGPPQKKIKLSTFYADKDSPQLVQKELAIARQLKNCSEEIRSLIGSPETMPKGLVITFMSHLCDASRSCREVYEEVSSKNRKLLDLIHAEILDLRNNYPELAKAGEELQKAVANYQLQKS